MALFSTFIVIILALFATFIIIAAVLDLRVNIRSLSPYVRGEYGANA